ncbi:MAG: CBS domain-containing protein [Euryarchaeota archaeon]|nr:CBS domain-containing protein [Euryarchaeota archaeon]
MVKDVVTLEKGRKLTDATSLMKKNRISRVVVTDNGNLYGILTKTDIVRHMGSLSHGSVLPSTLRVSSVASSELVTIESDASLKEAAKLLYNKGISSLPVVDDGQLKGILTTTDLARTLRDSQQPIEDIVTKPYPVGPEDRVVHARRVMLDNDVDRVVVLEEGRIVGILTERDVGAALEAFKKDADRYQSSRIRQLKIGDVMTRDVVSLDISARVGDFCKLLLDKRISGVPVTREGKLVGMVTKKELPKVLLKGS